MPIYCGILDLTTTVVNPKPLNFVRSVVGDFHRDFRGPIQGLKVSIRNNSCGAKVKKEVIN